MQKQMQAWTRGAAGSPQQSGPPPPCSACLNVSAHWTLPHSWEVPAGLQRGGSSAAVKQMLPQTRTWEGKVDGQEGVVCRMGERAEKQEEGEK